MDVPHDDNDPVAMFTATVESLRATVSVSFARRFTTAIDLYAHSPEAQRAAQRSATPRSAMQMLRGTRNHSFSNIGAYRKWCNHADAVGFPVGGMQMVLGVDAKHLYVFTTTFVRGRPKAIAGSIALRSLAQITFVSGIAKSRIVLLYADGALIELETMSRAKAKAFVATATDTLHHDV